MKRRETFVHLARRQWAGAANAALSAGGLTLAIDPRSHADRKLDKGSIAGLPRGAAGQAPGDRNARGAWTVTFVAADDDVAAGHPVPDPDGRPISVD